VIVSLSLTLYNNLRWANALSHKLEVGKRRSLASHYTLTTGNLERQPACGVQNYDYAQTETTAAQILFFNDKSENTCHSIKYHS